jgi:hypothetical protein
LQNSPHVLPDTSTSPSSCRRTVASSLPLAPSPLSYGLPMPPLHCAPPPLASSPPRTPLHLPSPRRATLHLPAALSTSGKMNLSVQSGVESGIGKAGSGRCEAVRTGSGPAPPCAAAAGARGPAGNARRRGAAAGARGRGASCSTPPHFCTACLLSGMAASAA